MFNNLAVLERLFPVCSSVWSNSSLSFSSSVRLGTSSCFNVRSRFREVAVIQSPSVSSRALRRAFLSSRMLPGQPVETLYPFVVLFHEVAQQETGQREDILRAFRKERDTDGELVQPVEQVLTETSPGDGLLQVLVGGGDQADVKAALPGRAHRPVAFLL